MQISLGFAHANIISMLCYQSMLTLLVEGSRILVLAMLHSPWLIIHIFVSQMPYLICVYDTTECLPGYTEDASPLEACNVKNNKARE